MRIAGWADSEFRIPNSEIEKGGCLMARIQIPNDPSGRIIVFFSYTPLIIAKVKDKEGG